MQGKILIVDGISTNRIVLKVKLSAAFYQVLQAGTIEEALDVVAVEEPDLILSAMTLPDGTAAHLCKALRTSGQTAKPSVLAIGSAIDTTTRLDALRAGAFDVMQRPVNEMLLMGRVRNMLRAHHKLAEWQIRDDTTCALGLAEAPAEFLRPGAITLVGTEAGPLQTWVRQMQPQLRASYSVALLRDAMAGLHAGAPADAVVIALPDTPAQADACLQLIPALRASAQTRNTALLVIQKTSDPVRATSALDMGADDVMITGFDAAEAGLRLNALLHRKRQVAQMLQSVRTGLREVVHDPLTGLYNRRYATPYMDRLIRQSASTNGPLAVILADMDHFKRINDVYGHASGDAVLIETARRLNAALRPSDMIARIGGEEFLIAMPATDLTTARRIADRLCHAISAVPFIIPGAAEPVAITISIGLTSSTARHEMNRHAPETVESLIDRADKALYGAKMQGRNRVALHRPHSRPAA
ncbi:diguanylate cyclase [uncultured Sulfitobacter sp.]|uniref:diguanylate cyclase n=1 Tax=uncultured Sulfitobacter sp. TaxID=191468 RepID=UPI002612FE90|nr:diguanylate cyclase [uncultured Sulfitobacter sp.]